MGHVFLPTPFVTQYRFGDQALRTLLPAFAPCFSKRQPPPKKKKWVPFFSLSELRTSNALEGKWKVCQDGHVENGAMSFRQFPLNTNHRWRERGPLSKHQDDFLQFPNSINGQLLFHCTSMPHTYMYMYINVFMYITYSFSMYIHIYPP